jgi:signal transduction histidine kinase
VPVEFHHAGSADRVPASAALCVYRALQEALRNIARHSRAGQVKVRLVVTAQALTLTVHDSGVGFDPGMARVKGGLGLLGMSDRVAALNGKLSVESAAGEGATIKVTIPHAGKRVASKRLPVAKIRRRRERPGS